jgi:glycyl-tRNA synthetase beta chain
MEHSIIADLLEHPRVVETRTHVHHSIPKHDHLMRSARYSYRIARFFRADRTICVRAAILHDLDSRKGTLTTHGAIAADVARELGEPEAVSAAIISHMYPFGPRPTTREGWVLAVADKMASFSDMTAFVRGLFTGKSMRLRRMLHASDPYFATREPMRSRMLRARFFSRVRG